MIAKPKGKPGGVTLGQARWWQDHAYTAGLIAWEQLSAAQTAEGRNAAIHAFMEANHAWQASCTQARITRAGRTGRRKPGSTPRPASAKPGDNPAGQPAEEQQQAPGWDPATGLPVG